MINEEWKNIKGYDGLYKVSNLGRVINSRGKELYKSKLKYYYVKLCHNNKKHMRSIHRLVAEAFVENLENKKYVNHINGNKLDNRALNLEWCTASENMKHAYENNLEFPTKTSAVNQYNLNGKFIKTWQTIKDAKEFLKNSNLHITDVCKGKRKSAGGYIWEYAQKEEK